MRGTVHANEMAGGPVRLPLESKHVSAGPTDPHTGTPSTEALAPELARLPGTVLDGKYRIDSVLGIGGMGAVFKAEHVGLKRDVAIKVLHPQITANPEMARRFDREAQSGGRLDHPNCLHVTDFGTTSEGLKYLAMQILVGCELIDMLGVPVEPRRTAELILQITRGLEHAHAQGIIHRDLKPENVFVTFDHEGNELLKLVDFGIAKVVEGPDGETQLTKAGIVFGTPHYMSPEQAVGDPVDHRGDLYALGILMHAMLTSNVPFDADSVIDVMRQQVSEPPPPLPEGVPEPLRELATKLLHKDKEQRPQSATEVCAALETFLESGDHSTQVPVLRVAGKRADLGRADTVLPTQVMPPQQSTQWYRWLVPGAVGVGGLALVVWLSGGDRGSPSADVAQQAALIPSAVPDAPPPPEIPEDARAPDASLEVVDRALEAQAHAEARTRLAAMLDRYPNDARVMWRQGRLQATGKSTRKDALETYADALAKEPSLLSDPEFAGELADLMHDRALRTDAVNLAIRRLGLHGHPYLIEYVSDVVDPLPYNERQRAMAEIRTKSTSAAQLDPRAQIALDLMQAGDTPDVCATFDTALAKIEADPNAAFLGPVHWAKAPRSCPGRKSKLGAVRAELVRLHGKPPKRRKGAPTKSAATTKSGPGGGDGSSGKSQRCKGIGGLFRRGC